MEAADILPFEQVHVLDVDNGARLTTYAIEGERGSGQVCINGAAARLVSAGDTVIILTYDSHERRRGARASSRRSSTLTRQSHRAHGARDRAGTGAVGRCAMTRAVQARRMTQRVYRTGQPSDVRDMKKRGEKIVMMTAYDYPTARLVEDGGADVILVGDTLGMVVLGYDSTLPVTMEDMIHHTKAVVRGTKRAHRRRRHAVHELSDRLAGRDAERRALHAGGGLRRGEARGRRALGGDRARSSSKPASP